MAKSKKKPAKKKQRTDVSDRTMLGLPDPEDSYMHPDEIEAAQKQEEIPDQYGSRDASFVIDENTVLYYFNYIGEVCMGHCIKALMDPDLGPEMAWIYLANVNDNFNTETDIDPIMGTIGPFETVKKSSEVYLYDPTTTMEDFMPTEWWKFATGDVVASEGG